MSHTDRDVLPDRYHPIKDAYSHCEVNLLTLYSNTHTCIYKLVIDWAVCHVVGFNCIIPAFIKHCFFCIQLMHTVIISHIFFIRHM